VEIKWTIAVRTAVESWLNVRAALPAKYVRNEVGVITDMYRG